MKKQFPKRETELERKSRELRGFVQRRRDRMMKAPPEKRGADRERDGRVLLSLLILSAFLLLALGAIAQMNVTGRVRSSSGALEPGTNITFYPLSTPVVISDTDVITSSEVGTNADTLAAFSVPLLPGDYRVVYGGRSRDAFIIAVTATNGSATISTLIKSRLTFTRLWVPGTNDWTDTSVLLSADGGGLLLAENGNYLKKDP